MFIITQHQYDLIMQQAQENFPYETGGALCGTDDGVIKGVMPIYNQSVGDQKKEFGITPEDIQRSYDFAKKHNLKFFGIYHTHPHGIAYPSDGDLSHNQRFLFIISLQDRYNPQFAAYSIKPGRKVTAEEIQVVNNNGVMVLDITTGAPKLGDNTTVEEMTKLAMMIDSIIEERIKYPRFAPKNQFEAERSSFNTEA